MSDQPDVFRTDARVERRAECAPPDVAIDVILRGAHAARWFLAYLGVIAAGSLVTAFALPDAQAAGVAVSIGMIAGAALVLRSLRQRRNLSDAQRAALPLRCSFTRDALVLEGNSGESTWSYDGVRAITRSGEWLSVALHGDVVCVLRESSDGGESLADFLMRRAKHLHPHARLTRTRRRLVALALVYVALVCCAVVFGR